MPGGKQEQLSECKVILLAPLSITRINRKSIKTAESTTDLYQQQIYQSQSKNYQDKFNNDLWWIGITAGLSVIDAYVDAHLYNFESEKQKILLHFSENGVVLQYKF